MVGTSAQVILAKYLNGFKVKFRYVDEVLARDELPADATIGRKLMDIVQTVNSVFSTLYIHCIKFRPLAICSKINSTPW